MDDRLRELEPMLRRIISGYFAHGHDRDDLLQEARIGAWEGLRDFNGEGSLRAFVWLCAERRVQTAVKTSLRGKHEVLNRADRLDAPLSHEEDAGTLGDLLAAGGTDPLEMLTLRDELRHLVDQLNGTADLTELERAAVVGVDIEGFSYDEIRAKFRTTRKAIDNAVQRARRKLTPPNGRRVVPLLSARRPPIFPTPKGPIRMSTSPGRTIALEAVRAEITETEEEAAAISHRLEQLRIAEGALASLNGDGGGVVARGPHPRPTSEAKSKRRPMPRREPAPRAAASKGLSNAEIGKRNAEEVIACVNGHPEGIDVDGVAEKLGRSTQSVGNSLRRAVREGQIVGIKVGNGPRGKLMYRPKSAGLAPAAANGAKTALEGQVLEALKSSHVSMPAGDVASRAKCSLQDAVGVLRGLCVRGLVELHHDQGVAVFSLVEGVAEAA